ncbi:MAG: hypothetical protein GYB31_17055 [Bacteroidetes bacterium]|nr:hypothetical protein [Bacteroidota bacterium]
MELANLKSSWMMMEQEILNRDRVDIPQIANAIHHKSTSEIAQIQKALKSKFAMGGITCLVSFTLGVLSWLFPEEVSPLDFAFSAIESTILFFVLGTSLAIMLGFNFRAFQRINRIRHSAHDLKTNLRLFIDSMESAISFNIYSDTLMTPVIVGWIYYGYVFRNDVLRWDIWGLMLIVLPILVGLFSYFFQRYTQYLKFGKYLDVLKGYWEDLENSHSKV